MSAQPELLKFALIGCGRIGTRHAEHIHEIGKLTAVCDIRESETKALAKRFGCRSYLDLGSLLSSEPEVSVVSICTPNGLHAADTIQALKAGFHVLCEKPMATTVHDCGKMIDAAEKANRRLFIVKQNRYNPPVIEVKRIIDEGQLGQINSVALNCFWNRNDAYYKTSDWKGKRSLDGGTLFTQFSHFIDLLYWMIGDVKSVHGAIVSNKMHEGIIEFEDTGMACLEFYNGAIGTLNYTVNAHNRNMEGSLTIFGAKGTVKIGGQYLNELEYHNIHNVVIENLPKGNPPNQYGQYQGSMSNHGNVYQNVADVLLRGGEIATHGLDGLKTVEIIEKIYSSAKWL